jgi:hypothetical protein
LLRLKPSLARTSLKPKADKALGLTPVSREMGFVGVGVDKFNAVA